MLLYIFPETIIKAVLIFAEGIFEGESHVVSVQILSIVIIQDGDLRFRQICVTVLGHSPLSRPVAWRRSSSPIGLGYRCYASTHPLNALQMAAPRAAI